MNNTIKIIEHPAETLTHIAGWDDLDDTQQDAMIDAYGTAYEAAADKIADEHNLDLDVLVTSDACESAAFLTTGTPDAHEAGIHWALEIHDRIEATIDGQTWTVR